MKHFTFLMLLILGSLTVHAQYTGGKGGSYASAQWVKPGTQAVAVDWGANPGIAGNGVSFQVTGARNRVSLRAWDASGRQLTDEKIEVGMGLTTITWGLDFAVGIYLLQLDVDGRIFTRKQVLIHQ